jgi:histidine ammonia-lyase
MPNPRVTADAMLQTFLPAPLMARIKAAADKVDGLYKTALFASSMALETLQAGEDATQNAASFARLKQQWEQAAANLQQLLAEAHAWAIRTFTDLLPPQG